MCTCKLCSKYFKDVRSLSKHLFNSHEEITREEYYNSYISTASPVCECGKRKKFRNLNEGYRRFCSVTCRSNYVDYTGINSGKKQSKEVIEKRISSTNQRLKEEHRKKTMLERYGVDNPSLVTGFLEKRKDTCFNRYGVSSPTQRPGSMHGKWKSIEISGRTFKVQGYEDLFLLNCEKFGYSLNDLTQGKRNCPQIEWFDDLGKKHIYFPDFFVQKDDLLIEIKSTWTFQKNMQSTLAKLKFAKESGYKVLCYIFKSRSDLEPEILE